MKFPNYTPTDQNYSGWLHRRRRSHPEIYREKYTLELGNLGNAGEKKLRLRLKNMRKNYPVTILLPIFADEKNLACE